MGTRSVQLQRPRHAFRQVMSLFSNYLSLPYLIEGIWFTLAVTGLGLAGGLILGLVLAAMQLSRFWMLAAFARGYTVIFRGTPLILQMVFAYDALPQIGLKLSAIGAAGLALATCVSVIPLFVDRVLDPARPAPQYRFARLLPWYRAPLALEPITAGPVASTEARSNAVVPFAAPVKDVKASRADRTKRSATLTRNDAVVEVNGLYKAYDSQPVLAGVDMT